MTAVSITALTLVVLPAIGAVGQDIPPATTTVGIIPTEVDTGGQSNDCALFNTTGLTLSQYRVDNPKTQSYTTTVGGRTVTFALTMGTGQNKDKLLDFTATGATVYYVGVKGGTNTAKYDYAAAPVARDTALHGPRDNQGKLYSVSNTTFCFTTTSSIGGTVFNDLDGDGTKDGGEGGLVATVSLRDGATEVASTVSSATGAYSFTGVSVGSTYTVCQASLGAGWKQTLPGASTTGVTTCSAAYPERGYSVALATAVSNLDFGNAQIASISGRVLEDDEGTGDLTGDGALSPGMSVSVTGPGVSTSVTSDTSTGSYTFTGLLVGQTYTVCAAGGASLRQTAPASGPSCTSGTGFSIALTAAGSTGSDFGFVKQGTISGSLFDDANANGVNDSEGPVEPARNVYLFKGTTQVGDGVTATSAFSFGSQDVGSTYTICVEAVTGQVQTYPTNQAGSTDCSSLTTSDSKTLSPRGWSVPLTTSGSTTLGFGSLTATTVACGDVFGAVPDYRVMLASDPPCTKSFLVDYSDPNRTAEVRPVGAGGSFIPMVEYIRWTLPDNGTQIELRYDDVAPYTDNVREMLKCNLDPRANDALVGPAAGNADLVLQSPIPADSAVFPSAPSGYDARGGLVTSCWILTLAKDGDYVAYVYSSVDGFRQGI